MLMMLPPRARAIMRGATARVPCSTVFKLARTRASQPFSLVSRKAARNVPPTLLTSTSMPPKRSTVAATARSTASPSRTSAGSARACPPARSISAAVERAVAASSSRTATRAPNAARPRAIPFPMPAPAPVTTAVRPVRAACCGSIALLRRVADEHALAALEAVAELVGEVRPARGVLAGVLVHQALLDGGVVDDLAARIERWPVGLADRDARLRAPLLDAPHAPGGGRRADVDRLAVVVEPDLRRLPERARLPLALDVDVFGLAQRALELGRERGPRAGDQRENQDEGGDAAHGNLLGGQAADLTAGGAGDASLARGRDGAIIRAPMDAFARWLARHPLAVVAANVAVTAVLGFYALEI